MPVGGDRHSVLDRADGLSPVESIHARDGYRSGTTCGASGFPGLAESQMGVYLPAPPPPLQTVFPTELAYTVEPGPSLRSGGRWGLELGGPPIWGFRILVPRSPVSRSSTLWIRPDPPAPPVVVHRRELDALGLGAVLANGGSAAKDRRRTPWLLAAVLAIQSSYPATSSSPSSPRSASRSWRWSGVVGPGGGWSSC